MQHIIKWLICLWVAGFLFAGANGCGPMPGDWTPEVRKINAAMMEKVQNEGILDKWLTKLKGRFINPKLVSETAFVIRTSIGAEGAYGEIDAEAGGHGTQVPKAILDAATTELGNPELTLEQKIKIIEFLDSLANRPSPAATAETVIAAPTG